MDDNEISMCIATALIAHLNQQQVPSCLRGTLHGIYYTARDKGSTTRTSAVIETPITHHDKPLPARKFPERIYQEAALPPGHRKVQ